MKMVSPRLRTRQGGRMTIIITVFRRSPDHGRGLARDMPVRWALEEVGRPYDVRLISLAELKQPAYRALNPFGQIPAYQEDDLTLFESGAIVSHVAQRHGGLLPENPDARARAVMWMFAALNTMEPPIVDWGMARMLDRKKSWFADRLPGLEERVEGRLGELSQRLGETDWLDDDIFSAGDLMMIAVLRRLNGGDMLTRYPNLLAYVARGEARPAFKRAFAGQLAVFEGAHGAADTGSS